MSDYWEAHWVLPARAEIAKAHYRGFWYASIKVMLKLKVFKPYLVFVDWILDRLCQEDDL